MERNNKKWITLMRLPSIVLVTFGVLAWGHSGHASEGSGSSKKTAKTKLETIVTYKGTLATVNSYIVSNKKTMIVVDGQRSSAEAKKL